MVTAAFLIGLLEVGLACLIVYGVVRAIPSPVVKFTSTKTIRELISSA